MTPRDFRTEGIILSKRRQGETDYFVDIISPEFGKLTVIAKGALKINSQFLGKLEIGQRVLFNIHTTSYNYLIIKNCETIQHHDIESFEVLTQISKLLEMLKKIEFLPQFNEHIFILLAKSLLMTIEKGKSTIVYMKTIMLNALGHLPEFTHCHHCHESLKEKTAYHSLIGEVCCQKCKTREHTETLSFNQLKILNYLKSINWNIEKTIALKINDKDLYNVERYIDSIVQHAMHITLTVH